MSRIVEYKSKPKTVSLDTLAAGDFFAILGKENLAMVISIPQSLLQDKEGWVVYIDNDNWKPGYLRHMLPSTQVIPVKVKITVEIP